jgi:DeoR family glycerol-3-phosphate regulon repressor
MDYEDSEAEFARALLSRAERRVLITDATKFGRRGLVTVCGFGDLDALFTDAPVSSAIASSLKAGGVKLTLANQP